MKFTLNKIHAIITLITALTLAFVFYTNHKGNVHFFDASYVLMSLDKNYRHDVAVNFVIDNNTFHTEIIVRELDRKKEKNYYKVLGEGKLVMKNTHQYYLKFDNIDVYKGTNENNLKPFDHKNITQTLIEDYNPLEVLHWSNEYIVIKFFFYDGQILILEGH